MGTHVLLDLLSRGRQSDKMQGLPSILLLFHNNFSKFNNIVALMFLFNT